MEEHRSLDNHNDLYKDGKIDNQNNIRGDNGGAIEGETWCSKSHIY